MAKLKFTNEAASQLKNRKENVGLAKRYKAALKALGSLEINPRHPGLNTHLYDSLCGTNKEKVYEAYAENQTPGAYRIFWHYGPDKNEITIIAITPHP